MKPGSNPAPNALTTARPYRQPLTPAGAQDVMREETAQGFWDAGPQPRT